MRWRLDRDRELKAITLLLSLVLILSSLPSAYASSKRDYVRYVITVENYQLPPENQPPGDFLLEVGEGSLTRGWVLYSYSYTTSEPYTASRQVVASYTRSPSDPLWVSTTDPAYRWGIGHLISIFGNVVPSDAYDRSSPYLYELAASWSPYWERRLLVVTRLEPVTRRVKVGTRQVSYEVMEYEPVDVYRPRTTGDGLHVERVLAGQRMVSHLTTRAKQVSVCEEQVQYWRRMQIHYYPCQDKHNKYNLPTTRPIEVMVGYNIYEPAPWSEWEYDPEYGNESYTAYYDVEHEGVDYLLENWPTRTFENAITIQSENGFEGRVWLSVGVDDGRIEASLADDVLYVPENSENSTALTLTAGRELCSSPHEVTVFATDGYRTGVGSFELELSSEPRPGSWEEENSEEPPGPPAHEPPRGGERVLTVETIKLGRSFIGYPSVHGPLGGVHVEVHRGGGNGPVILEGTTDSEGFAYLPLDPDPRRTGYINMNITVVARKPGWVTSWNDGYVGTGSAYVGVGMTKGEFVVRVISGRAESEVVWNGSQWVERKQPSGKAKVIPGYILKYCQYESAWTGGYASTSVRIPQSHTHLKDGWTSPSSVNPSSPRVFQIGAHIATEEIPTSTGYIGGFIEATSAHARVSNRYWAGWDRWRVHIEGSGYD